ncbi:flagellar filament capping protein FliD [Paenibacillus taichungensis]|uniref:flagellar filament capping protein FliD n=1 Tax=Paenibacillus taichungensis TaxID=484184 RepID=UPI0039A4526B
MATTRIMGMASGMDIESIVKQLMTAEKKPLDKLNQNKQVMEWKREGYRETSVKLVTFAQSKISDIFSKASALNAQTTKVTGNTTAVTAKATSSASGVMDITVGSLAKAASTKSLNAPTNTGSETDWGKVLLSDISGVNGAGQVKINGASITIDTTETLNSFVDKINSTKAAGVTAIYNSSTGEVSITSKTTGAAGNSIELDDSINSTGVFSSLGLGAKLAGGTDSSYIVNGLEMTNSSNTFTLNGVELTLNSVSTQATHIDVSKDTDKIVETVQSFVDAYNELLSFLNTKVNEEKYSKYPPLTSDQKSGMSESEVDLWTNKAKSGMLKRDSILENTISEMRAAMVQGVKLADGTSLNLTQLGITTGGYETKGKLILDQDKLKTALNSNPDIVNDFFATNYSTSFSNTEYTQSDGVFAKMKKISTKALNSLNTTAGTSKVSSELSAAFINDSIMGNQLRTLDTRISDMESRLTNKENSYYKKFTAMETAINKYNNTSSSLSSFM